MSSAGEAGGVINPMDVFFGVVTDLWQRMWDTRWLGVLILALVVAACVRRVRAVVHGLRRPDSVRRFSAADKATILSRAGNRCEYHHVLSGRCPNARASKPTMFTHTAAAAART